MTAKLFRNYTHRYLLLALALTACDCTGALQGGTINLPGLPKPVTHNVGVWDFDQASTQPIAGVSCTSEGIVGVTNGDGFVLLQGIPAGIREVVCTKDGYQPATSPMFNNTIDQTNILIGLKAILPPLPTRDEILNVHLSFQGLTVQTAQFGALPWFEAALPWLTPADRQAAYAAKHASTAWDGGDTHALIFLPSGTPLYDEPNQPYSADRFGALDWTAGNTHISPQLADLIVEAARAGFSKQLLFEGGDAGEAGFPIAMTQLDLLHDALLNSAYGDLRGYVIPIPGFDGVFYGYTPQHIYDWINKCRTLFPYCGLEHSTAHIPAGEGPAEWWLPSGPMRGLDLLLSEFDDDRFDDSVWQIAGRLLGPAYRRPSDQPSTDDPEPPAYLKDATERGPIVNCAFEFGLYGQVHGQYDGAHVNTAQRPYFKNIGYTCGG